MEEGDKVISLDHITARPKEFSTGSTGYFVFGKVTMDGKRYQLSGNLVEINSAKNKKP
jgi:hypothetical protein